MELRRGLFCSQIFGMSYLASFWKLKCLSELLISARYIQLAQPLLNQTIRRVKRLLPDKIDVVIRTKKRIAASIPLRVSDAELITSSAVRYLGVTIDTKMTFWRQILRTADNVANANSCKPELAHGQRGRRLLMTTVQSILRFYGSEVWADALNKLYRKRLVQVHKRAALFHSQR